MKSIANPFLRSALLLAATAAFTSSTQAATLYWDITGNGANGATGTGAWNGTNAFWNTDVNGVAGTPQAGTTSADDLIFSAGTTSVSGTVTLSAGRVARSLTFEETGDYTLTGGSITLSGPNSLIFTSGTGANTIASTVTFAADTAIANNDNSNQTISGNINGSTAVTLTNSGTGTGVVILSGAIGSNISQIIQNSATSQLNLTGTSGFSGNILIKSGTLLGSTGTTPFGLGTGTIYLGDTATNLAATLNSNLTSTSVVGNAIVLASGVNKALTIISPNTGSQNTFSGGVTGTNDLILSATGSTTAGGIRFITNEVNNTGKVTANGSGLGTITIDKLGTNVTSITLGGTVNLTVGSAFALTGTNKNLISTGAGLFTMQGAITGTQDLTLTTSSTGGIALTGLVNNTGAIITAGTGTGGSTLSGGFGSNVTGFTHGAAGTATVGAVALGQNFTFASSSATGLLLLNGSVTGAFNLTFNANAAAGITASGAIGTSGSITNSGTGAGTTTISSNLGSSVTGVTQNSATSGLLLSGANTYTAATNISAGTLTLGGGGSLAGTTVTAAAGTTFAVTGNSIIGTSGSPVVNLGAGSTLSLQGGSINTVNINSATAGATVLNFTGGVSYGVDLLGSLSDSIVLGSGLKANISGGAVNIIPKIVGTLTSGTRTVISASGGGLDTGGGFTLDTGTGNFGGNTLSLTTSGTLVQLNVTAPTSAPILYFNGAIDNNLGTFTGGNANNSNFSAAADGLSDAHVAPDSGTELHIQANNLASAVRTITLGRDLSIKALVIDSKVANALTIAPGDLPYNLTLTPTSATTGITVNSSTGGTVTISAGVILGANQAFTNTTANNLTISGNISGTGDLALKSNAAIGATTNNGLITLSGGINHTGSITNNGTGTATSGNTNGITISGVIGTNVTGLLQNSTSSGGMTISGATGNTFTGLTTVTAGSLTFSKGSGNATNGNILINGGNLGFGNDNQIGDTAAVTITSGSFNTSAGVVNSAGTAGAGLDETIGSLTVSGSGFFSNGNQTQITGVVVTGNTSFTGGSGAFFFNGSGGLFSTNSLTLTNMSRTAAQASGADNANMLNGFIVYGNNNTRQSVITVGSGGLTMNGTSAVNNIVLRSGSSSPAALGSKLVLDGNVTTTGTFISSILLDTLGGTTGSVSLDLSSTSAAATRTFNIGGPEMRINVSVRNGASTSAGITKTGSGILVLNAANTYTGTTTVSNGTLLINGASSAATGNVTVASGATLGGNGTVGGATTINGIHAAGNNAIGLQTFSSTLTYAAGSAFSWQLGSETTTGAGTNFDAVTVAGTTSITNATFRVVVTNLNLNSTFWASNKTWDIFEGGVITGGFSAFELYNASNLSTTVSYASRGSFSFNNATGSLNWTVPEPSNALAGLLVAAGLIRRRRSNG